MKKVGIVVKTGKSEPATEGEARTAKLRKKVAELQDSLFTTSRKVEIYDVTFPPVVKVGETFTIVTDVKLNAFRPFTWCVVWLERGDGRRDFKVTFFTPLNRQCRVEFHLTEEQSGEIQYYLRTGFNPILPHDERTFTIKVVE